MDGRWGERVLTKVLRRTRILVVSPGATSPLIAAQGWLYDLLVWVGVDHATARHLQDVVVRPVGVVVILLVATAIGWSGSRVIRRWIGAAARRATARADSPRAAARAVA